MLFGEFRTCLEVVVRRWSFVEHCALCVLCGLLFMYVVCRFVLLAVRCVVVCCLVFDVSSWFCLCCAFVLLVVCSLLCVACCMLVIVVRCPLFVH